MTEVAIFRVVLLHFKAIIQTCGDMQGFQHSGKHTNAQRWCISVHRQTYIQSPEQHEESNGEACLLSIPLNV